MAPDPSNPPESGFPMNVVDELKTSFETLMIDHTVISRPLRFADPARSIGVFVADWTPTQTSQQIGQKEPSLARYQYRVQNMVKTADEVTGKAWFSLDSKSVRAVLYRDPTLEIRLPALIEEVLGTREIVKQWGVGRQRFLSNELRSQFLYLAQTDFWLETEAIQL